MKKESTARGRVPWEVQPFEGCAFACFQSKPVQPGEIWSSYRYQQIRSKTTSPVANEQRNRPRQVSEIALINDGR